MDAPVFHRPINGRLLGGVCAGLADRWVIDRNLVRFAFAMLGVASGIGVAIYVVLWLTLPTDSNQPGRLMILIRGNARELGATLIDTARGTVDAWGRTEQSPWPRPMTRRWLGIGLVIAGAWLTLASLGLFDWINAGAAIGLGAIAVGVALIKSLMGPQPKRR